MPRALLLRAVVCLASISIFNSKKDDNFQAYNLEIMQTTKCLPQTIYTIHISHPSHPISTPDNDLQYTSIATKGFLDVIPVFYCNWFERLGKRRLLHDLVSRLRRSVWRISIKKTGG